MTLPRGNSLLGPLLAAALLVAALLLTTASAQAAVGVEKVSRSVGPPGAPVTLTLGCGFCFPPCKGEPGHRHPSPCMLGTKGQQPPASFPISLVPVGKAPGPHKCGPRALCPPESKAPPGRAPFTLLGEALPVEGSGTSGRNPPRYQLDFEIPDVAPGRYAFVIFCDVCLRGKGGSLIAVPGTPNWQLRVRPPVANIAP